MGSLPENQNWEPSIYEWETTDVVQGGPGGLDNLPLTQLANRTQWLKSAMSGYLDITYVGGNRTLSADDTVQKMVIIDANATSLVYLPVLPKVGMVVSLMAWNSTRQVAIVSQSGANIIFVGGFRQTMYLGEGESFHFLWSGDYWYLFNHDSQLQQVGMPVWGYSVLPGTIIANGQVIGRSSYPRLWEYVQNQGLIDDYTWNNTAGYKGFFSSGDGATNFRVPDLRSMFIRGLDMGANIDFGRNSSSPGGYEGDTFASHTHAYNRPRTDAVGSLYEQSHMKQDNDRGLWTGDRITTEATGSTETRPKNIGLIPLIKI